MVLTDTTFPTHAVQAAFFCGSTNIFVGGRLRLFCGRSRKGYVLIAINTVPSRSSRYIAVSAQNRGLNRISGKVMLVYVIGAFYILMMTV